MPHTPNERVEQIRQRLQAATPGPWEAGSFWYREDGKGDCEISQCGEMYTHAKVLGYKGRREGEHNATFIAHAPEDVAYLLEQLEAAQATVAAQKGLLDTILEFSVNHHADQPKHLLLHALAVDIPAMCCGYPPAADVATGPGEAGEGPKPRPWAGCESDCDGYCDWKGCPQLKDNEPYATGRHCPLDTRGEDDEEQI